jgi:hypothetical protein
MKPLRQLGMTFALALFCVSSTGCFKMSNDARALRDSVTRSAGAEWNEEIEIGVGALTLNLARFGLSFVDLDPEARTVLSAARSADVGVYRTRTEPKQKDFALMLANADHAMIARGWDRMVTVMEPRELVAVYVPGNIRSTRDVRVCLVVLNGGELVVASARSNLEPLLEMAFNRSEWHHKERTRL